MSAMHEIGEGYSTKNFVKLNLQETGGLTAQNPVRVDTGATSDVLDGKRSPIRVSSSQTTSNPTTEGNSSLTTQTPGSDVRYSLFSGNSRRTVSARATNIDKPIPPESHIPTASLANAELTQDNHTSSSVQASNGEVRETPSGTTETETTKTKQADDTPKIKVIKNSTGEPLTVVYAHDIKEARELVDSLEHESAGDTTNGQKQDKKRVDSTTETSTQQKQRVVGVFPGGDEVPTELRERYRDALGDKTGKMAVGTEMHVRAAEGHVYPEGTITGFELPSGKVADGVHIVQPEADATEEYELFECKSDRDITRGARQADDYRQELAEETGRRVHAYVVTYSTHNITS